MKKVLYLAAGNPVQPRVGMDLVIHEHIKELAAEPSIELTVVAVAPGISGQPPAGVHSVGAAKVQLFVGDLLTEKGGLHRALNKVAMICRRSVPVMAYSFFSQPATRAVRSLLAQRRFDVVVIDHYYALTNIDLNQIVESGAKVVYVSHDAMYPHIAEMASMKAGALGKAYYMFEAWRTGRVEKRLFNLASKVVHLSEFERNQVREDLSKHLALLPPICSPDALAAADAKADPAFANTVVFIGSPNHPPNAHALNWIIDVFAPALAQVAPQLQVALVGGGTDRLAVGVSNVRGYGFVSSETLQQMLASCVCSISPVVRGRGIKVKVLDAIAAGCPVFATEESLRGFEQFGLPPSIQLELPTALVDAIAALAADVQAQASAREDMAHRWANFLVNRQGRLAALLSELN